MIQKLTDMFIWVGNSDYVIILSKEKELDNNIQWIVWLQFTRQMEKFNFYILKDKYITKLPNSIIWQFKSIYELFLELALNPEECENIFLINNVTAQWAIGDFLDVYIYNYFNSSKVDKFTKNWIVKNDNVEEVVIRKPLISELDSLELLHNAKFSEYFNFRKLN